MGVGGPPPNYLIYLNYFRAPGTENNLNNLNYIYNWEGDLNYLNYFRAPGTENNLNNLNNWEGATPPNLNN